MFATAPSSLDTSGKLQRIETTVDTATTTKMNDFHNAAAWQASQQDLLNQLDNSLLYAPLSPDDFSSWNLNEVSGVQLGRFRVTLLTGVAADSTVPRLNTDAI
jgi:hypothetical protein